MRKKLVKKTVGIITTVIIAMLAMVVVFAMYCNMSNKVAYICGYAAVKIVSPSMKPTIPVDEYILLKKADAKDVKVGDVIAFYSRDPSIYGKINTHRVISISNKNGVITFNTKGDNNTLSDKYPVSASDISGIYVKNLSFLTKISIVFEYPLVFFLIILVPALVLLVLSAIDFRKKVDSVQHDKKVEEEVAKIVKEMKNKRVKDEANVRKTQAEETDKEM